MVILEFLQKVISSPAILVGLIAFIGLLLQKASFDQLVKGTIKTILGFTLISAGAGVISGTLGGFDQLFQLSFNVEGIVPNTDATAAVLLEQYATATTSIMTFGMIANIVLARFSRFKYIFLTGHLTMYMAAMLAGIFTYIGFSGWQLILIGSLMLGLMMAVTPAFVQPTMRKVTGNDDIALGHFATLTYWIGNQVAKLFRKDKKSTEEIKFSKSIGFMRDTSVSISIIMFILYLIITVVGYFSNPDKVAEIIAGNNIVIYSVLQAVTFAGGVYIVLAGVRLVLGEIVPAFQGLSEKLVPNAKPAIDCPVVFPFAPNAVLIGFIFSFVGALAGLGIILLLQGTISLSIVLPGVVPIFFTGATAGVLANAEGGYKGCIAGAFTNGLISTILSALLMPVIGSLINMNITFGDSDFTATGLLLTKLGDMVGANGVFIVIVALFILPILYNLVKRDKKNTL